MMDYGISFAVNNAKNRLSVSQAFTVIAGNRWNNLIAMFKKIKQL